MDIMSQLNQKKDLLRYLYTFTFDNGLTKNFEVLVDQATLLLAHNEEEKYPEWTKLNNFACPHCPLNKSENIYCPVAVNLKDIIDFFSDMPSFEIADIKVETNNRIFYKKTSVQSGVSGIIGIIMPTSGCPITAKLRPMVKFHLPFASIDETEFRVFSMYLFAQYLKQRKGDKPDWEMKDLKKLYDDILLMNQNIARRIADLEKKDTSINAVVVLNNFADSVAFSLDEDDLSGLESYFSE
ncbi:MAG: hypothetical protein F9K45_10760, partial [Melioribacteraceae bacterium]